MSMFATRSIHVLAISGIAVSSLLLLASSGGITGMTRKSGAGSGCTCHGSSNSGVVVSIVGPSTLAAGAKGTYQITVTGGPLSAAGTNIAASSGILEASANGGLQLIGDELTHVSPRTPEGGTVTFGFAYTAPSTPGSVTLYANGNSVNLSGDNTGDSWNFAPNMTVTITSATDVTDESVPLELRLEQNYPNPFNPTTNLEFRIQKPGNAKLSVFDVLGQEVAVLVNAEKPAGVFRATWDATDMPSGIYVYRLQVGNDVLTKKMTLLR